jgi:uncharacterized protein (TIGR02246 family)
LAVVHITRGWWFSASQALWPMVCDTPENLGVAMRKVADRRGIVALVEAIERAWNAGDVKSYARLYAQDAAYLTRAGILWTGRKAIERGHAAAFRGELKGSALKIRIRRLRFLTPRTAVAHCAIELNRNGAKQGHKIRAATRFELRKIRTRWEIVAAQTRELPARRK